MRWGGAVLALAVGAAGGCIHAESFDLYNQPGVPGSGFAFAGDGPMCLFADRGAARARTLPGATDAWVATPTPNPAGAVIGCMNAVMTVIAYEVDRPIRQWRGDVYWTGAISDGGDDYNGCVDDDSSIRWIAHQPGPIRVNTDRQGRGGAALPAWLPGNATRVTVVVHRGYGTRAGASLATRGSGVTGVTDAAAESAAESDGITMFGGVIRVPAGIAPLLDTTALLVDAGVSPTALARRWLRRGLRATGDRLTREIASEAAALAARESRAIGARLSRLGEFTRLPAAEQGRILDAVTDAVQREYLEHRTVCLRSPNRRFASHLVVAPRSLVVNQLPRRAWTCSQLGNFARSAKRFVALERIERVAAVQISRLERGLARGAASGNTPAAHVDRQLRENLHASERVWLAARQARADFRPRVRPLAAGGSWSPGEAAQGKVPSSWGRAAPTKKGVGVRWTDPANRGNGIRIDAGNPANSQVTQQVDHVIGRFNGQVIGRSGQPISGRIADSAAQAHIPLSEWLTWSSWFSP